MATLERRGRSEESRFQTPQTLSCFFFLQGGLEGPEWSCVSVRSLSGEVRSRSRTFYSKKYRSQNKELQKKKKNESSLKLTAVEGWRISRGEEKEATFTVCSLLGSQCADLGRGGGSAVFSRRSFLCVGLMAPSGGRDPQSNLLSPQNTLCYKTHTPSGTDSALNFLPVILAAGQRKKKKKKPTS